jgi:spore photoproduct lyase
LIYIQDEVADHWRTHEILSRLPDAARIPCDDWRDVFRRPGQNFRLQKRRPALVLGARRGKLVQAAPPGWSFGARLNYTVEPMLNCIYDCRFCYLQGRFRSAAYAIFVNYEDFLEAMDETLQAAPGEDVWFFPGVDCDTLALEPVARLARSFLPFFAERPRAFLELRTKSTQVKELLDREPLANCITAFSLVPADFNLELEHQTPALESRLAAARRLQEAGWPVGLRFDPLLWREDWKEQYAGLFARTFEVLDGGRIHSVSCGPFRLPIDNWKRVTRLYPEEPFFAGPMEQSEGAVTFRPELAAQLRDFCQAELRERVPERALFFDAASI